MLIESNQFQTQVARQTARGAAAATPLLQLRQTGTAGLDIAKSIGNERYGDGQRFSDAADYVESISGGGSPVFQGTPEALTAFIAWTLGAWTRTDNGDGTYGYALRPADSSPYLSFWKSVGDTVSVHERYNDSVISSLTFDCGVGQRVAHITPTIVSLDAGEVYGAEPTASIEVTDQGEPLLWTDATGELRVPAISADPISEVTGLSWTVGDGRSAVWTDDVLAHEFAPGTGAVTVGATTVVSDRTIRYYNLVHYGTPTPAPGAKPGKNIPYGEITWRIGRGSGATREEIEFVFPRVRLALDSSIQGNPDGGATELTVAGETRRMAGREHIEVDAILSQSIDF